MSNAFQFKQFTVVQNHSGFKVGTDGCLLGAWADVSSAKHILDIGTGSGLIALMLAQRNTNASIIAIEINAESAAQASENFANSSFSNRLTLINQSLQLFEKENSTLFDHVVCNPPFFANSTKNANDQQSLARHDDSLRFQELFQISFLMMSEKGSLSIIIPFDRKNEVILMAKENGFYAKRILDIKPNPQKEENRTLLTFELAPRLVEIEHWNLYSETNVYSSEAKNLLAPFYLKL
jgi:tRNA1Val (adenine37-N6)-methyltransferase